MESTIYSVAGREFELQHYGVLGMKWGIRRARRKDAKQAYKSRTNKAFAKYEREIAAIEKPYKRGQNLSKADLARQDAAERAYSSAVARAKQDYKRAQKSKSRDAEIANRLYSKQSKEVNARVANMSMGKALVQANMMGSYGALKYNEARANKAAGRGKAAVEAFLYSNANMMLGGALSAGKYLENRFARKRG